MSAQRMLYELGADRVRAFGMLAVFSDGPCPPFLPFGPAILSELFQDPRIAQDLD